MNLQTSLLLILLALYPRTASSSPGSRLAREESNVTLDDQMLQFLDDLLTQPEVKAFLMKKLREALRQEDSTERPPSEGTIAVHLLASTETSTRKSPATEKTANAVNTQLPNSASLAPPTYQKTPVKTISEQGDQPSTNPTTRAPKITHISETSTKSTTKEPRKTTDISPTSESPKGTTTKSEPGIRSTNPTKESVATKISPNGTRGHGQLGSSTNGTTYKRPLNQSKTTETPTANNDQKLQFLDDLLTQPEVKAFLMKKLREALRQEDSTERPPSEGTIAVHLLASTETSTRKSLRNEKTANAVNTQLPNSASLTPPTYQKTPMKTISGQGAQPSTNPITRAPNGTRGHGQPGSSANGTTNKGPLNQSKTTETPTANNGSIPSANNTKPVQSTGDKFVHHGNMFPAFFLVILFAVVATYFCYHNKNKIQTFLKTGYSRTKHKGSGYLKVKLEDDIDLPRDANRHYVY